MPIVFLHNIFYKCKKKSLSTQNVIVNSFETVTVAEQNAVAAGQYRPLSVLQLIQSKNISKMKSRLIKLKLEVNLSKKSTKMTKMKMILRPMTLCVNS